MLRMKMAELRQKTEDKKLLGGWLPQSLHHADKIYIVRAAGIIYCIYKYKHLHLTSYKYSQNSFRYQLTLSLLIQTNATTELAGQGYLQTLTIKIREEIFQWHQPLSKLIKLARHLEVCTLYVELASYITRENSL